MHITAPTLILALSLGFGLATPAAAQDTTTPAAPAADEAPAADQTADPSAPAESADPAAPAAPAGDAGALTAGDPAAAEDMIKVRDTFGDWEVRCAPNNVDCFLYQLARDNEDNPVAEISIIRIENEGEAKAGVTILTPLGTLLTSGLVLQVDEGELRRFPFSWCDQAGCFGRLAFDQASVDMMKKGTRVKLTVYSIAAPNQAITLEISLSGFTRAFDSVVQPSE